MQIIEQVCLFQIDSSSILGEFDSCAPKLVDSFPKNVAELGDHFGEFCFIDSISFSSPLYKYLSFCEVAIFTLFTRLRKKQTFSFLISSTYSRKFVFCSRFWLNNSSCQCLCSISSLYGSKFLLSSSILTNFHRPWDEPHWEMLSVIEKEFLNYGFESVPRVLSLIKIPKEVSLGETVPLSFPVNSLTRPSYRDDEYPFGLVLSSFSSSFYNIF